MADSLHCRLALDASVANTASSPDHRRCSCLLSQAWDCHHGVQVRILQQLIHLQKSDDVDLENLPTLRVSAEDVPLLVVQRDVEKAKPWHYLVLSFMELENRICLA